MHTPTHPLERFWTLLASDDLTGVQALIEPGGTWDDPLYDAASGDDVPRLAIPRLAAWYQGRAVGGLESIQHLRTTADGRRVAVESVLAIRDGMIWDQVAQQARKSERIELAVAVVGDRSPSTPDRSPSTPDRYQSIRIYFSTWAVLDGASRLRVGPICPDERARTRTMMDAMPTVRDYFARLATGDAGMVDLFEPDGYFREPANNFACGRDQLELHFQHILKLGGVGIEFLTATRQDDRIGIELQTVLWGPKRMAQPQAGFAAYELGPHGKMQGARVYDSVVPPEL